MAPAMAVWQTSDLNMGDILSFDGVSNSWWGRLVEGSLDKENALIIHFVATFMLDFAVCTLWYRHFSDFSQ